MLVLLVCGLAALCSGCRKRVVQAAPPTVSPPLPASPAPIPPTPPPEIKPQIPPESPAEEKPVLPPPKAAPPRPLPPPSPEPEPPSRPEPPQIVPQLSPQDQAIAERRTQDDLRATESNLRLAYGKQLNVAQNDLVEKIRSFLEQAHEAIRASDWVRARNLAQKARVLSVELVNSL